MRDSRWLALGGMTPVSLTTLRYAGWCGCGAHVSGGDVAGFDHIRRRVLCLDCVLPRLERSPRRALPPWPADPPPGTPGGSARREYERRRRQRRERVEEQLPHVHRLARALALALAPEPARMRAWLLASRGEERVGAALSRLRPSGVLALHDRRIPGRRTNIDHIAIGPAGVFVIDAKPQAGTDVEVQPPPGAFGLVERLMVGGRDRTEFLGLLQRQVLTVQSALESLPGPGPVLVRPVLCFAHHRLPLRRRLSVDNVPVVGVRGMARLVRDDGPLDAETRRRIYLHLAARLPSMT